MTLHPTLHHFKKRISLTSQWTETEYKNIEKIFLGIVVNAVNLDIIYAVYVILDFIYYIHFETHIKKSLW